MEYLIPSFNVLPMGVSSVIPAEPFIILLILSVSCAALWMLGNLREDCKPYNESAE